MLEITIPKTEQWDESNEMFVYTKETTLRLEHSLVSLSKWESTWRKPFLTKEKKSHDEELDYIRHMTVTSNVDPGIYNCLSNENIKQIKKYINASMTATTFSEKSGKGKAINEQITSELIYYWMITLNIPMECQKWHLNRLITLIEVCNIKNQPSKKMGKKELMNRNTSLNAARKKRLNTKG